MKLSTFTLPVVAALTVTLHSCLDEKDGAQPLYTGSVTVVTDWSGRDPGSAAPDIYFIRIGDRGATVKGDENIFPVDMPVGTHKVYVYNTPSGIDITHTDALREARIKVNYGYAVASPDWFFSWVGDVKVEKDRNQTVKANMQQQVRDMKIILASGSGDISQAVTAVKDATLSGLSAGIMLDDNSLLEETVALKPGFELGTDTYSADMRIFGPGNGRQMLSLTLVLRDGTSQQELLFDLTSLLSGFRSTEKDTFILTITLESFDELTGEIDGWNINEGYVVE